MCKPEKELPVLQKIKHSVRQTWYGGTLIYIAMILTLMFFARIFNWQVG